MSSSDWQNLALTVLGVFGLALLSRVVKRRMALPAVSPWLVLVPYNLIWAAVLLAGRYNRLNLPAFVLPVALVGGNAALVNLFGLPLLRPLGAGTRTRPGAKAAPDPDREKLLPKARKKKRSKRRR